MAHSERVITINDGVPPTVVFVSQLGGDGDGWRPVIDRLASGATTITYDRPGIGGAPPRPAPNPPLPYSAFAAELAELLEKHRAPGPYVVVGHSVGSLIARVFAHHNPDRVAGMVHVDGSIPRLSLWPLAPTEDAEDGDGKDATRIDAAAGEAEAVDAIPPAVPTAVVTRTPGRWTAGFAAADELWSAYQRQLARHSGADLVVADNAGHQIPREAPYLVAHVIDAIVTAARDRPTRGGPPDEPR